MHLVSGYLQRISNIAIGVLMAVLSINVLIQILSRQIMKISTPWTDEVARFSFIWMVMIAASAQVRKRAHFTISVLADAIPWKRAITIFIDLVVILVALCLFYYGVLYCQLGLRKVSSVINMRMIWIYAAIPAGSFFMIFYGLEMLMETLGFIPPPLAETQEKEE